MIQDNSLDKPEIVMHGMTANPCFVLAYLSKFRYVIVDGRNLLFDGKSIAALLKLGYATFNLKTQTLYITDEGIKIGKEVKNYADEQLRLSKGK